METLVLAISMYVDSICADPMCSNIRRILDEGHDPYVSVDCLSGRYHSHVYVDPDSPGIHLEMVFGNNGFKWHVAGFKSMGSCLYA